MRSRFICEKNNCNKSSNRTETGLAQLNKMLHLPVKYEYIYVNINQFHSHTARHMPIPTYSQTISYSSLTKICIYIIKHTLRVWEIALFVLAFVEYKWLQWYGRHPDEPYIPLSQKYPKFLVPFWSDIMKFALRCMRGRPCMLLDSPYKTTSPDVHLYWPGIDVR